VYILQAAVVCVCIKNKLSLKDGLFTYQTLVRAVPVSAVKTQRGSGGIIPHGEGKIVQLFVIFIS